MADFSFSSIRGRVGSPVVMTVAAAEESDVLTAVRRATDLGIVRPLLCGDGDAIHKLSDTEGISLDGMQIEHCANPEAAASRAVSLVAHGDAAMVMKGLVDTSVLLKAVLDRDNGLRSGQVLSHLAIFELESYPRPLGITDAAMNIAPDLETKRAILENAVAAFHRLGYAEPRVAVLAAKEKVNPKMPATVDAAELAAANERGEITGCLVDGPFALDNAVDARAAATKGVSSPVAGNADILLVPTIESGNVLYKALAFLTASRHAGVIVGARAPIVLTSRADSEAAKLDSIALAAAIAR